MMKIVLPILVFGLLAGSAKAADSDDQLPTPPRGKAWKLVWHDEFDGDITMRKLPDRFLVDYVRVYDAVDAK